MKYNDIYKNVNEKYTGFVKTENFWAFHLVLGNNLRL